MRTNVPQWLIVHHTGGSDANPLQDSSNFTFAQCNTLHQNNPNINLGAPSSLGYYIGYHYYIEKDGSLHQGRLDSDEGAHCVGMNITSLGICLAGNFDATLPTQAQIDSLAKLLIQKSTKYNIPLSNIIPHRHFASKTCYGNKLPDTWASDLVKNTPKVVTPSNNAKIIQQITELLKQII